MLEEFKKFAMRGNVVDLAVGFTVGAAFSTVAKSLSNWRKNSERKKSSPLNRLTKLVAGVIIPRAIAFDPAQGLLQQELASLKPIVSPFSRGRTSIMSPQTARRPRPASREVPTLRR